MKNILPIFTGKFYKRLLDFLFKNKDHRNYKNLHLNSFLLLLLICFSASILKAQNTSGIDRVREARVKFFNEKLNLTPDESKKFWPVYNDYQSRKNLLAKERKNIMAYYLENGNNMTPEEISKTLDRYVEIQKEETGLLELYTKKFKQVLADEKVLKIYITEIQFRNYLLKQLRTSQKDLKIRN